MLLITKKILSVTIFKMRLTYDDKVLLSIAMDGTVCIWNVTNTEGKTVQMDKEFAYSKEILISRNELEVKKKGM